MGAAIHLVDPTQNEILTQAEKKTGKPNHFFRAMANRPEVLKNFIPLYGSIVGPGSVERRLKELVYLTVAFANQCAYCSAAHIATGRKAGITEDEIAAVRAEQSAPFSVPERAAIAYARELTRSADAPHSRGELAAHFTSEQIVEITLVAAMANFTNRFNNGLQLMPEE